MYSTLLVTHPKTVSWKVVRSARCAVPCTEYYRPLLKNLVKTNDCNKACALQGYKASLSGRRGSGGARDSPVFHRAYEKENFGHHHPRIQELNNKNSLKCIRFSLHLFSKSEVGRHTNYYNGLLIAGKYCRAPLAWLPSYTLSFGIITFLCCCACLYTLHYQVRSTRLFVCYGTSFFLCFSLCCGFCGPCWRDGVCIVPCHGRNRSNQLLHLLEKCLRNAFRMIIAFFALLWWLAWPESIGINRNVSFCNGSSSSWGVGDRWG